jgi:carboxymethylenebutenolidase
MDLAMGWTSYGTESGPVPAYRAKPAVAVDPLPAVIVIQEVWGVDEHIMDVTQRVATAGYLALAPDLYAVGGERSEPLRAERLAAVKAFVNTMPPGAWGDMRAREEALAALPQPQRDEVAESMVAAFPGGGSGGDRLHLLRAAVGHLRADPDAAGRPVGSMGFCMGGGLSAGLACSDPHLSAAAIFYGGPPTEEELEGLSCPLIGFYGGDDHRITDGIPTMAKTIEELGGSFEHHVYPGTPHAFFNDTRPSYRLDAARDAWARLLMFFAGHLGRT